MRKVKAFIFQKKDSPDGTIDIIMEDGGVATAYNPDNYYRSNYYQNRLNSETTFEDMWDELGEGNMYCKDWDGEIGEGEGNGVLIDKPLTKENFDIIVDDMIEWLYGSTGEQYEIVKIEMGELTDESYEKVKEQLNFNEE